MQVLENTPNGIDVRLTRDELGLLGNALNEVCNGVHIPDWEFQTRLSVEREELQKLLDQIVAAYRN
ncbi:MAG TPA: hypothetical protein VHW69_03120 [Rhizomicrobium sp.]|jgi:hypothetical protein|nr:hypothetical protein [Rhizomicrobium sp.]